MLICVDYILYTIFKIVDNCYIVDDYILCGVLVVLIMYSIVPYLFDWVTLSCCKGEVFELFSTLWIEASKLFFSQKISQL